MNLYDVLAGQGTTHFERLFSQRFAGSGKTQTLTGVPPLTFKADGTPLTSVTIKGNGQQNGTPSPQNIVPFDGTGDRTVNLFDKTAAKSGYMINDETGIFQVGRSTDNASDYIPVSGDYVSIYAATTGSRRWGAFYDSSKTYISGISGYNRSIAIPANAAYMRLTVIDELLDTLMLNLGSTAADYEPYGYKIPITCAGQTTPVYLGEVSTTRRVRKLVLTGDEGWSVQSSSNQATTPLPYLAGIRTVYCTHYKGAVLAQNGNSWISSNLAMLFIMDTTNATNDTAFKAYLAQQYAAGTPVTVWYVLETPETGIVNEPLAKIGTYADELSSVDAGVSIPTAKGQNVLTVDTDLQPSEMTITYKG